MTTEDTVSNGNETKQPGGLFLLFFVEMWERFSYYGMRCLLVLYMVKALQFSTEKAGHIYGWYTGMVYLTPLIGGWIADRYLGQRKAIVIGGTLMALGHFAMAFNSMAFFFSALMLLILGNGFFKPNISTVVGSLYHEDDPRRDGGFTIFYMGINLGALFSSFVCGTLGEKVSFHLGFAAAGVGMVLGLTLYLLLQKKLLGDHCMKPSTPAKDYKAPIAIIATLIFVLVISAMHFCGYSVIDRIPRSVYYIGACAAVVAVVWGYITAQKKAGLTRAEKEKMGVVLLLTFFSIFFWAAFEQAGSSLTLFAEYETNRVFTLFGHTWTMPTSYFQSVNPLFIILLAPLFSEMWIKLARRGKEPSTPIKFVTGLGLLSIGFMVMIAAASVAQKSGIRVSMLWLVGAYMLHTMGELCLSPVGLSMVTKLAPAQFASLLMGTWFLSSCAANFVGGILAGNYDAINHAKFFAIPTSTALLSALVLLIMTPKIKKWMHGIH